MTFIQDWLIDLFVILMGLLCGSFYNVVAIRLLQQKSLVSPASHCPRCHHSLSPLDLIPVISFFILKGKCRYCRAPISGLYPLGEWATAVLLYMVYLNFGFSWEIIPAILLVSVLLLAVMTDLRQKVILDVITLPALIVLIIIRFFIGEESLWYYLGGGVLGFVILLLIAILSKGGMGGGDVKLYAVIGVVLGPWLTLMSLGLASFAGTVVGVVLMWTGQVQRKQGIPFAPFILIGTIVAYLYGVDLWNGYVEWIGSVSDPTLFEL